MGISIKHIIFVHLVALFLFGFAVTAFASETSGSIVTGGTEGYGWSDQAGWVNFGCTNCGVSITDSGITGYAWNNNYGWINLNPTNGGVLVAASGALSGYVWGENLGWINFSGVSINSSGVFTGQATGDIVGTLTFDCTNCSVKTDYRPQDNRSETTTTTSGGGVSGESLSTATEETVPGQGAEPAGFPPSAGSEGGEEEAGGIDEEELGTPLQLFDIRLLIDSDSIVRLTDLVARVTFESFGRVPTPVDLTFTIFDSSGEEVWSGKDEVVVETEQVLTKRFSEVSDLPDLLDGDYTLRLHTLYNTDVEDDFEAPFTIGPEKVGISTVWWIGGITLLLFILIWFLLLFLKRRKKEEEEGVNM